MKAALRGHENIILCEPLDYVSFVHLMCRAYLVLTDSGGIQEEAPSLGKPVLVLREKTERPEGLACGTVKLAGTSPDSIVREANTLLNDSERYSEMACASNQYGDGHAGVRIAQLIDSFLFPTPNQLT